MRWSKLKSGLAELRAATVADRVAIHQARYRHSREELGRVWLTIDGKEIASFETATYARRRAELESELFALRRDDSGGRAPGMVAFTEVQGDAEEILRRDGAYDDSRALADLEAYLSMPFEQALTSSTPLLRALAMTDRRLGKRRLRSLQVGPGEHELVRTLYKLRCEGEGIATEPPAF
jgi:hypothetical protein